MPGQPTTVTCRTYLRKLLFQHTQLFLQTSVLGNFLHLRPPSKTRTHARTPSQRTAQHTHSSLHTSHMNESVIHLHLCDCVMDECISERVSE